jgi:hypothetical protein
MTRHSGPAALIVWAALSPVAAAQVPSAPDVKTPPSLKSLNADTRPPARRSIVHYNPYPYPGYYRDDSRAGFRNPGGVGRNLLWYPAGNRFQTDGGRDPVRAATFFSPQSGVPTMDQMIAGQAVGVQKYNAIQQHIDNFARPFLGYGLGVGYFGGFF